MIRICEEDIESIRALATDLDLLFEADIIEFDTDGQRKIPYLKHDTVVAEPIA